MVIIAVTRFQPQYFEDDKNKGQPYRQYWPQNVEQGSEGKLGAGKIGNYAC